MKAKLCDIYEAILKSIRYSVDEEGRVSRLNAADKPMPVTVLDDSDNRLRLTLPTDALVRSGDWEGKLAFHPLSENIMRGESEIINLMRIAMRNNISIVLGALLESLTAIAADADLHKTLSPAQHELTKALPGADARTFKDLRSVLEKFNGKSRGIVKLFLKRNGRINGDSYNRAFILSFNLDIKEDRTWYGVQLRVKDVPLFKALMEFIIPAYDTEDWCAGSDSKQAPYLIAALTGYAKITQRLNDVINMFPDPLIEDHESLLTDTEWVKYLPTLLEHVHDIPPLKGNDGKVSKAVSSAEAAQSSQVNGTPMDTSMRGVKRTTIAVDESPVQLSSSAPGTVAEPKPTNTSGKVDFGTALQAHAPQSITPMHQTPVYAHAPQPQMPMYNNAYVQQPGMYAPAPQQGGFHPPQQQGGFAPQAPVHMSARERSDARAMTNHHNQVMSQYGYVQQPVYRY